MKRIAVIFIALFAFLTTAPAAMAHDTIESIDPSAGEVLEAGVVPIIINFAEPVMVMDGNEGTEIQVTDEAGNITKVECLSVLGNSIGGQVDLDQPGLYVINWRTVSEDGHPVDGTSEFSIQNTSNYESTGEIPCAYAAEPEADQPMVISAAPAQENNTWVGLLIGMGFVVVGSVAGALSIKLRERRQARKTEELHED